MTPVPDARIEQELVDAIGSLANRQRLEILLALAAAERERQLRHAMSFTELYDAVDTDSTSQFAYHLGRLVGTFVVETPEGYRLAYGGDRIVRAVLSGVYESPDSFDDVAVDGVCIFCASRRLRATLSEDRFVVRCRACETTLVSDYFPRSQAIDRTPAEIVESFGYRIWATCVLVRGGVCPECYGRVDTVVDTWDRDDHDPVPPGEADADRTRDGGADADRTRDGGADEDSEPGLESGHTLVSTCSECWLAIHVPLEISALFHPAAAALFWEHDVSLLDTPLWECFAFIADDVVTADVASTDPLDAGITITLGGETRRFAMDETLAVTPVPSND